MCLQHAVGDSLAGAGMNGDGKRLTHLDAEGAAHMVDVGGKPATARRAVASGRITMSAQALEATAQNHFPATPGALCAYCDYARICTDADRAPAQPWAGLDEG